MTAPVAVCGSLSMLSVRDSFDPFRHALAEVEAIRGISTYPPDMRCHGGPRTGELSQDIDRDRTSVIGSQPRMSSAAQFGPPFLYVNSGRIALSWDRIELNRGNAGRWSHPAPPVTVQDHPPHVREPTRWGPPWGLPPFLIIIRCPKVFRL